ncbi:hypothetical protein MSNKSG1_15741 [Marinobacter santoriniensis NKSG1]|uniref:Lipoprotein n=1 Tax=Marinobacter santoriniensis NKSG1 TaxID=1288826 RepID=M7CMP2_9GAMM|nr:hypothetical protein [Marinobacter santoriniensis]EMP54424.1 hypothetical protein MSNKSG1_15741 [Marinobacter santoriniensis NKSG1]
MKVLIACAMFSFSLFSGCASLNQESIQFHTSNNAIFELRSGKFDSVRVQPFETQLWLDANLVGSITTMKTNSDFSTAVEEVRQGFREAQKSSGKVTELDLGEGNFGFSVTVNGYTTAFIATSQEPLSWATISMTDSVSDDVLSNLRVH